jgi:putative membrane protein
MNIFPWVKSLHIVFVISWFAGLFYLPRILVNLAQETDAAAIQRLLLMARKLYRFMTILAVPALIFGLWLWLGYGFGQGPNHGWLHANLSLVLVLIGYHHACGALLKKFETGRNKHSHVWFRWFNEIPVLVLLAIVVLVVVKPF